MTSTGRHVLETARAMFRRQKLLGERALAQVPAGRLHEAPGDGSNSLAVLVKHIAGNQRSRWTDFLTADGEKAWRHRDREFEDAGETREDLMRVWRDGWATLFRALEGLGEADLLRTVRVRGREHTVHEAIQSQLGHYSYHVGQLVYVARLLSGEAWETLSVPRGESERYNESLGYRAGTL
jgi:hypothetical protein